MMATVNVVRRYNARIDMKLGIVNIRLGGHPGGHHWDYTMGTLSNCASQCSFLGAESSYEL